MALAAFALLLSRRPQQVLIIGAPSPFKVLLQGVEAQKLTPLNVYEGYDHSFALVFKPSGTLPKWWGKPISGRSGTKMKGWHFFLERGGKRAAFAPGKTQIWTSGWDDKKKRYTNEFLLHCGQVPADATLKMSGQTRLSLSNGTQISPLIPFEVVLKKAGERWTRPIVSRDPHIAFQKIQILPSKGGQTVALLTVVLSPGTKSDSEAQYSSKFFTPDWKEIVGISFNYTFSTSSTHVPAAANGHIKTWEFGWNTASLTKAPQPDLILTQPYAIDENWPLEIAFQVKKGGKPVVGVVPILVRPHAKSAAR